MNITELRAKVDETRAEILRLSEIENIEGDDDLALTALVDGLPDLEAELEQGETRERIVARIKDGSTKPQPPEVPTVIKDRPITDVDITTAQPTEVRDAALRAIEDADKKYLSRLGGSRAEALEASISKGQGRNYDSELVARRIVATSQPAYQSAFLKGIAGNTHMWDDDEKKAMADVYNAATIGTDTEGGFGVPVIIDPTLLLTTGQSGSQLIDATRVETITNDEWKGVSSADAAWSMDAEAAQVSDDALTIAQPTIKTEKPQVFIPYSFEVGMDWPGFASEMGRAITVGYRRLVATQLATGDGISPNTTGIFVGTTTAVDVGTDNQVNDTDVDAIYAAVPEDFRDNGSWVMNVGVENLIRAFGSGTATSRFTVDQTAEGITLLNGKPVVTTDHAPAWTAADAQNVLTFGDMEYFVLAQRLGLTLSNIPFLMGANQRPTGQSGLYGYARFGSGVTVVNAFRRLKNITT